MRDLISSELVRFLFDFPPDRFPQTNSNKKVGLFPTVHQSYLYLEMAHTNLLLCVVFLVSSFPVSVLGGGFVTQEQLEVFLKLHISSICVFSQPPFLLQIHLLHFVGSQRVSVFPESAIQESTAAPGQQDRGIRVRN